MSTKLGTERQEIVALKMIKMNMEDEYGFPFDIFEGDQHSFVMQSYPSNVNVKEVVVFSWSWNTWNMT